ncbi:MAG: DUF4384 domain-containing protein, partial [Ignavibacteria bacterium]|nr:DUF4384 domain-containing protein [Ignavibacteria bacterium]
MKVVLISLLCLWASLLNAEEKQWFDGYGDAVANDTRSVSEVKQEALAKARRAAIERAVGVMIQSDTLVREFVVQSDFTAVLSSGHIIEEKIVRWDASLIQENDSAFPIVTYKVFIKAKVGMEKGKPDPAFKIKTDLNRTVFKDGDSVAIEVKSTKDCYLNIFVVTEKNDVYLIFPNRYKKDVFVKRGEVFVYPSENDIVRGLTLKAGLLP